MKVEIKIAGFTLLNIEVPARNRIVKSNISEGSTTEGLAVLPDVKIIITCNNHVDIDKVRHLLNEIINEK